MAMLAAVMESAIAKELAKIDVPGVKEAESDSHVTILYLGDFAQESVEALKEIIPELVKSLSPIECNVSYVSYFPPKRPGKPYPVILPVEAPNLHSLRDKLVQLLDKQNIVYPKDYAAYQPHITLAYSNERPVSKSITPMDFTIRSLDLFPADDGDAGRLTFYIPNQLSVCYTDTSISTFTKGITLSTSAEDKLKAFKQDMDTKKSLANMAAVEARRAKQAAEAPKLDLTNTDYTIIPTVVDIRKGRNDPHMAPVSSTHIVETSPTVTLNAVNDARTECGSCGYMFKSIEAKCRRCVRVEEGKPVGERQW